MSQLTEYETRLQRLQQLKKAWIIPYANKYDKQYDLDKLVEIGGLGQVSDGDALIKEWASQQYRTAGRMMTFRSMGKLSFATITDATADIQVCFVKWLCSFHTWHEVVDNIHIDGLDRSAHKFAEKFLDIWDFIWVAGELFVTKHGELTLFVDEYQLLSKALRPLGDKRHGIQDEEKKYRQRYLDMTMNNESFGRFKLRANFLKEMRKFYRSRGFDELDTPILWNAASGAAAKPFVTHHEDFDTEVVMRIAPEIALKMATVWRFEKVFEIGRNFRNEWSSPAHMQEFTVVEHYCVYWNYEDNMRFMEEMFDHLIDTCHLPIETMIADKNGKEKLVNRTTPRQRIDYIQAVHKVTWLDVGSYTESDADQLRSDIQKLWHSREGIDKQSSATMIDYLYKKVLRPTITGPAFVYNYPKTMQPLARQSDTDSNIVEQFQVVVNGREICKAYSELVDPVIQQANFDEQSWALAAGDEEATSGDDDFVHCMEYGMPCQSWFGMGIERVLTFFTWQTNIRDVTMFPLMKPKHNNNSVADTNETQDTSFTSSQDTMSSSTQTDLEKAVSTWATLQPYMIPGHDAVTSIMDEYLSDTRNHCQQVGEVMKFFAQKLWEDTELRYTAWLLHDIDRDHVSKDPENHLWEQFDAIMDKLWADDHLRRVIKSHYPDGTGVQPERLIEKYLISVDEMSGFLYAYSLMRPEWFTGMQTKWVKKRIKNKWFASWVDRDHLRNCETYLGISLDEFIPQMIEAMKSATM